ncbi:MAG: hypothetical protein ACE5FL_16745, partial [Myxococcota bacterium]
MSTSARGLLGSLIAVPLVALVFGSQWSWDQRVEATTARIVDGASGRELAASPLVPGVRVPPGAFAEIPLPRPLGVLAIELVADRASSFQVAAIPAAGDPIPLWLALA